jgi:hypothetical protein
MNIRKLFFYTGFFLFVLMPCDKIKCFSELNKKSELPSIGGCAMVADIKEVWSLINSEGISNVILCYGDIDTIQTNSKYQEINLSQVQIQKVIDFLEICVGQSQVKKIIDSTRIFQIKIVTKKKHSYFVPAEWLIYGNEALVSNFREYLKISELWPNREFEKKHNTFTAEESNDLEKAWIRLKNENIHRIITCTIGADDIHTLGGTYSMEFPQQCIEDIIELLDNAIRASKIKNIINPEEVNRYKIITDKGGYLLPAEWFVCAFRQRNPDYDSMMKTCEELLEYIGGSKAWTFTSLGENPTRYNMPDWTKCHSIRKVWSKLKNETIQKIIICCSNGYEDVDKWSIIFEIPNENIKEAMTVLNNAMNNPKKYTRDLHDFIWMKIITDKCKYITPLKMPENNIIYGSDWSSSELMGCMRKCD